MCYGKLCSSPDWDLYIHFWAINIYIVISFVKIMHKKVHNCELVALFFSRLFDGKNM